MGCGNTFTIVSVAGTRPEAIKLAPVAIEAATRSVFAHKFWASGQQTGLFDDAIAIFGVTIDRHLDGFSGVAAQDAQVARLRSVIRKALEEERPALVLVQGDTNTALAAAEASHDLNIPVGHIEAGLRTHVPDRPYPEEANRVRIAQLATLHFAPSQIAAQNLRAEGVARNIHITGNPGIDALLAIDRSCGNEKPARQILVTCHRRENFGPPIQMICEAVLSLAESGAKIILPVHSNPAVADPIRALLGRHRSIEIVAPLPYPAMIAAIKASVFVLSDSGGLQEECAALGVPLLLMRNETERPEVVAGGNCILVGSDRETIVRESQRLLSNETHRASMARAAWPYGGGGAASKITDAIMSWAQG